MSTYLIISITFAIGLIIGLVAKMIFAPAKTKSEQRSLDYFDENYLSKQGFTKMYGDGKGINYNLKSFDGGKNWYVVQYNFDSEELKVLGSVNDVYPGLMDNLDNWDKLLKYVKSNGPLGNNGTFSEEDKKIMKKVGLETKKD